MAIIHAENWDGVTAPTIPSGWNIRGSLITSTSGATPISSPNMLECQAGASGDQIATWGTQDGNSGNVEVQGTGQFGASGGIGNSFFSVLARGNASSLSYTTSTFYEFCISGALGEFQINAVIGGTSTNLLSVSQTFAHGVWYQITATLSGSAISATVQRLSDSFWLDMSTGVFQSSSVGNTASITDSSISGQGYAGLSFATGPSPVALADPWTLSTAIGPLTLFGACGTINVIGVNATLEHDREAVGSVGTIDVTGVNAALQPAAKLVGSLGTIDVVGVNASFLHDRDVAGAVGTINVVGKNATLVYDASFVGGVGTIDVVGVNASLLHAHKLAAAPTAIDVVGVNATLLEPFTLSGGVGTISVTGVNAKLEHGHVVVASPGVIDVVGVNASLIDAGSLNLSGSCGTITIGRIYAGLFDDHLLPGAPTAIDVVGVNATLLEPFTLSGGVGTISVTGVNAGLGREIDLGGSPTAIMVVGVNATLFSSSGGPTSYHVYANTGLGDPINYDSPIDATTSTTYTTSALTYPGTWSFGVRAYNNWGEEQNLDCALTIILNASGVDVTNRPLPPTGLRAFPMAQGAIRAEWFYPPTTGPATPTGFHVYTAIGVLSYATPTATVLYSSGVANSFVANMPGFANGTTYTVGVRAFNSTAEETNTNTVAVTAVGVGPTAVANLTASATTQS